MKSILFTLPILLLFSASASGQDGSNDDERAAVRQAALDYAEGYYEGDALRMERALHPLLSKRGLIASASGGSFLVQMNSDVLIEVTRLGRGKLDPDKRNIRVEVLDLNGTTASAKVFTAQFNDYLHLVRTDGSWRILNVLWRPPAEQVSDDEAQEENAVEKAMKEFRDAAELKDAERAARFLHPDLVRRIYTPLAPNGRDIVQEMNAGTLLELVRNGRAVPPGQANPDLTVLDINEDIASLRLSRPGMVDYLHLARQDGAWRIVNGLAARAPGASSR